MAHKLRLMQRKPRYRYWLLLLMVVLALMASQRYQLGQYLGLWSGAALYALKQPAEWLEHGRSWFKNQQTLLQQNHQLQLQLAQQTPLLQQARSLREENQQLRRLLHVRQIRGYDWQAAQVTGYSPDKKSRRLILRINNAKADSVVISGDGLVGLIDHQRSHYAVVRTILDASQTIPLTSSTDIIVALARGNGSRLLIDFVPKTSTLKVGDILQTSGSGGIYPPGLAVARITHIEAKTGSSFLHIEAVPVAKWQQERWLAVATPIH